MAALNRCSIHGFHSSLCSTARTHIRIGPRSSLESFPQFSRLDSCRNSMEFTPSSLKISCPKKKMTGKWFRVPIVSCLMEDSSEGHSESTQSSVPRDSQEKATIDLKLPRRSLLVTFTCNVCGARSQRLINRLAYERGLVYVQCSGCSQYHKLVDNLGLVVEWNLQEEVD